jgi:phage-related protein
MQTRRQFGKLVGTGALAVGIGEVTLGLSCASLEADLEKYVPIGLSAFQTIVSLVDPPIAAAVAGVITLVKAGFADVAAAVQDYQDAPAANKATLLGKISTAIVAVQSELQTFWNDLNLPDGSLATTISNLLAVILSTLAAFLPSLPAAASSASARQANLRKVVPFTPQRRSVSQFRKAFDAVLTANGHGDLAI